MASMIRLLMKVLMTGCGFVVESIYIYFQAHNRYHKLFNRNTVKLSYSCMPNMEAVIRNNNARVVNENKPSDVSVDMCNCRDAASCPLDGKCFTSSIVYKATIQKASGNVSYLGVRQRPFIQQSY